MSAASDDEDWAYFVKWMGKYHKMYKDEEETAGRFKTYKEQLNRKDYGFAEPLPKHLLCTAMSEFADTTHQEFKRDFLGIPEDFYYEDTTDEEDDPWDEKDTKEEEEEEEVTVPVKRQRIRGCDEEKDTKVPMETEIEES
ncbi:hypothetical protein L1987_21399 [Smallanthus sonchifolius]|uniref:Uncharacterized protein n=1 Tax=Smallanthus sonchifolius TaxID=185202 RepID=A0ACB9IV00_9ASTR|nr:hypothetical protein L1987_21399 [Smallanthus sonchifolius]